MFYDKRDKSFNFRFFVIKTPTAPHPLSTKSRLWPPPRKRYILHLSNACSLIYKKTRSRATYFTVLKCGLYEIMPKREITGSGP